jgi:hypothetical protein
VHFSETCDEWAVLQNEGEDSLSFPAVFDGRRVGGRAALMAKVGMSVVVAVTDAAA